MISNSFNLSDPRYLEAIKKATDNTVTQSEIMLRASCPRKWFYRYALKLDRISGVSYHLLYGSLMHAALAELYRSGHYGETYKEYPIEVPNVVVSEDVILTPENREEIELVKAKAQIAFNAYRMHYYKTDSYMRIISVEETYRTKFRGLVLEGKIDLVAHPKDRDGVFIWDYKTAGRFDANMLDAWSFKFQFLYYCWLYWRCTGNRPMGTMASGLAKTRLRPSIIDKKTKEKESREVYLKRVKKDMQVNREKFFYRQRMPMAKGMLERFEKEILMPHIHSFVMLKKLPDNPVIMTNEEIATRDSIAMAMNTSQCHMYNSFCEFLPLCKDGPIMLAEYSRRTSKHAELAETEAELGNE